MGSDVQWRTTERARWGAKWASIFGDWWFGLHPYSPDLVPSDYHLFLHLKKSLGDKRFEDNDDRKDAVQKCLTSQAAAFDEEGTQKRVHRYDKCLKNGGEYVEK